MTRIFILSFLGITILNKGLSQTRDQFESLKQEYKIQQLKLDSTISSLIRLTNVPTINDTLKVDIIYYLSSLQQDTIINYMIKNIKYVKPWGDGTSAEHDINSEPYYFGLVRMAGNDDFRWRIYGHLLGILKTGFKGFGFLRRSADIINVCAPSNTVELLQFEIDNAKGLTHEIKEIYLENIYITIQKLKED